MGQYPIIPRYEGIAAARSLLDKCIHNGRYHPRPSYQGGPETRLMEISGPMKSGKTELAVQIYESFLNEPVKGVLVQPLYISLDPDNLKLESFWSLYSAKEGLQHLYRNIDDETLTGEMVTYVCRSLDLPALLGASLGDRTHNTLLSIHDISAQRPLAFIFDGWDSYGKLEGTMLNYFVKSLRYTDSLMIFSTKNNTGLHLLGGDPMPYRVPPLSAEETRVQLDGHPESDRIHKLGGGWPINNRLLSVYGTTCQGLDRAINYFLYSKGAAHLRRLAEYVSILGSVRPEALAALYGISLKEGDDIIFEAQKAGMMRYDEYEQGHTLIGPIGSLVDSYITSAPPTDDVFSSYSQELSIRLYKILNWANLQTESKKNSDKRVGEWYARRISNILRRIGSADIQVDTPMKIFCDSDILEPEDLPKIKPKE